MDARDVPSTMRIVWGMFVLGAVLAATGVVLLSATEASLDLGLALLIFGLIMSGSGLFAWVKIRRMPRPEDAEQFYRYAPRARPGDTEG
jgi:DNA-binding helix-hairpin-helix protein with protein kinase domain